MAEAQRRIVTEGDTRPSLRRVGEVASPSPVALSIVIVTWNSEKWIDRCLRSIPAACEGVSYEIILHDNASSDQTLDRAAASSEEMQVIRASGNDGFAAGINRGLERADGKYVFLLNPDCELAPRALTILIDFLEKNPHAAAAAPLLVDESGGSQREFQLRRFPTLRTLASEILLLDKILPMNGAKAHYRYRDLDLSTPQRIEQPAAAAFLIRRSVFDEIGALDEQFSPAWFEDVDFCRRLAASGKEVFVVPGAGARHFGGASLEHMSFGAFKDIWFGNMWRYARKWMSAGEREMLRWVIIVGMLLRCVAAVAGIAHPEVGRWEALRAYVGVLRKAFHRWDG